MRQHLATALSPALVIIAMTTMLFASAHDGMGVGPLSLPDAPATLVETNHGVTDYLMSAKLLNRSPHSIVSYRIGWIELLANGKSKVTIGPAMNVPAAIMPEATVDVPAQGVSPAMVRAGTRYLGFFVAETEFADGSRWKANIEQVTKAVEAR